MVNAATRRDALLALLSLSAMGLFALGSWVFQFAWLLARLFIAAAIGWGLIQSFAPFPYEPVRYWQELVSTATLDFPGAELFLWCADEWFEIAVVVLLLKSIRISRLITDVAMTSHHAAFAVSALANYFRINPTTTRLLKTKGLWKPLLAEGIYSRLFRVLTGVPFLPEEAIPERKGRAVSLTEDLEQFATPFSHNETMETERGFLRQAR